MHELLASLPDVQDALAKMATSGAEHRGAIYTRREVVDFILDLSGYVSGGPLKKFRLLEPSMGEGDFLLPAIERLLGSLKPGDRRVSAGLLGAVRGVEIHAESYATTKRKVISLIVKSGFSQQDAKTLAGTWLIQGDYLLTDFNQTFSHVIGNPPYVRHEMIPKALVSAYKERYSTIYDRADIYIPFIEKSLFLLSEKGCLGFICADRWMKNKYGAPLRNLISKKFHLSAYVDMVDTDAFHSEVIAYPAITIITRSSGDTTHIAHRPKIEAETLSKLVPALQGHARDPRVSHGYRITNGGEPWMLHAFDQVSLVRRLEKKFPTLEQTGCKIGIGVATGADKIYVGDYEGLPVEKDRKLPLVVTKDILSGKVRWTGKGVVNPFNEDGSLVDLADYPKLEAYFKRHSSLLRRRNCAQRDDKRWYRTIDRITPSLAKEPKLLIPDIKGDAHIVFEEGEFYPHHNLYYITSSTWNLHALQAVLTAGIAKLFVASYSVQMAGGFLRFQAQYLRRIRIPLWDDVSTTMRKGLIAAGENQDRQRSFELVSELYRLTPKEQIAIIGKNHHGA